ncbi:hypothetical protein IU429_17695 [Nocardia elegans]|uniref:hypothetical protein n=1 Tax=Nocardia elegans TaxID=300029 RepID=UPI001896160A|nr:hypothetical protein [Nocardia elegans]MBF6449507.1 hypothetical protein [Nocardia elegans]
MDYTQDLYAILTDKVNRVVAAGGTVTQRYRDLDNRLDEYRYRPAGWLHDLATAVINGEDIDRVRELYTLTVAEAVGGVQGTQKGSVYGTAENLVDQQVTNLVAAEMSKEYSANSAMPNLKVLATKFDKLWSEFVSLSKIVDPETNADQIVGKDAKVQQAWLRQLEVKAELDSVLFALGTAADLAGTRGITGNANTYLGLVMHPSAEGQARKRVWEAWGSDGRCGRWSPLIGLGETLKAIQAPNEYTPYAAYQGVYEKHERTQWGSRPYYVDAETGERVNG